MRIDLPPERQGHAAPDRLLPSRQAMGEATPALPGVACGTETLGGVNAILCEPPDARGTIIYIHGGGFRMGAAHRWTSHGCRLALASSARVMIVDYRLAPEHPFPAGINDTLACYAAAARQWSGPMALAGDSSGGNIALATALVAAQVGPAAAALAMLCPWLDLSAGGDSYAANAETDRLFTRAAALDAAEHYLQGMTIGSHALTDLLSADLGRLPPCQVFASTHELVLSDTMALASRLAAAQVPVETHVLSNLPHVWATLSPDLPESTITIGHMGRFLRDTLQASRQ